MLREQQDPAVRLANSVARYIDALHVAAENVVGPSTTEALEGFANQLVPGLSDEPAWMTLRAHLLLLAASGADAHQQLRAAYNAKDLSNADDRAAVLDWRLDHTGLLSGPDRALPWLPDIPDRIAADPTWGPYLHARSQLVAQFADQLRRHAKCGMAAWADQSCAPMSAELIADVQLWRAATQVDPSDLRPTGPLQIGAATRIFQLQLDKRLAAATINEGWRWQQLLAAEVPGATADPFLPELAEKLDYLTRAGFDARLLLRSAAAEGPLPNDHPAAALWWRILDQLPPGLPNQKSATSNAVPPTTTTKPDHRRPVPRPAPARTSGPSP